MKLIILLLASTLLFGCSSTPTPLDRAKPVASNKVFHIEPLLDKQKYATFKILRDSASDDALMKMEIWIDGKLATSLSSQEIFIQKLNPREHVIEARVDTLFGRVSPAQVETIFRDGRTYFYRVGYNATARSIILTRDMSLSK